MARPSSTSAAKNRSRFHSDSARKLMHRAVMGTIASIGMYAVAAIAYAIFGENVVVGLMILASVLGIFATTIMATTACVKELFFRIKSRKK